MTMYVFCFVAGIALSALAFVSGLHTVRLFGHHGVAGGPAHGPVHHGAAHANGGGHPLPGGGSRMATVLSWLNMAAFLAFLTWFGGAGIVLKQLTGWSAGPILAASIGLGLAGGSIVNRFIQTLVRDERPLLPTSYVGVLAKVTSPIRDGGTGEIVYTLNGTRQTAGARNVDAGPLPKGAEVVITRYEKGIAYVSTFDELPAITPES
jgi:membrane protein implicated in regulation of membrane protease activity